MACANNTVSQDDVQLDDLKQDAEYGAELTFYV